MALPTSLISIPFTRGANTKGDKRTMPIESFPRLENVIIGRDGTLTRRGGYQELSGVTNGGAEAITRITQLCAFRSQLICVGSGTAFIRKAAAGSQAVTFDAVVGPASAVTVDRQPVTRPPRTISHLPLAYIYRVAYEVLAYRNIIAGGTIANATTVLAVRDPANEAVRASVSFAAGVTGVVSGAGGSLGVHAYSNPVVSGAAGNLELRSVDTNGLTLGSASTQDATAGNAEPYLAARSGLLNGYVAYNNFAGNLILRRANRTTGAFTGTTVTVTTPAIGNGLQILTSTVGSTEFVFLLWGNTTGALRYTVYSCTGTGDLTLVSAAANAIATGGIYGGITGYETTSGTVAVYAESISGALASGSITAAGVASVAVGATPTFGLASQISIAQGGAAYGLVTLRTPSGSSGTTPLYSYFLAQFTAAGIVPTGRSLGRAAKPNTFGGPTTMVVAGGGPTVAPGHLPRLDAVTNTTTSGVYTTFKGVVPEISENEPGKRNAGAVNLGGYNIVSFFVENASFGVTVLAWDLFPPKGPATLDLGEQLFMSGARATIYDGNLSIDQYTDTFNYPTRWTQNNVAGGTALAGAYQFKLMYRYVDGRGRECRSAPSVAGQLNLSLNQQINLQFTGPLFQGSIGYGLLIEPYVTAANGTVFYRVGQGFPVTSSGQSFNININPTSDPSSGELLYTQSGELDNDPPSPNKHGCTWQGSVVLTGLENPLQFTISKPASGASAPRFSDLMVYNVDPLGGEITGCAALDDKLILFKRSAIFGVIGQTPDVFGQSSLTDPQIVAPDVGCADYRSIVTIPEGVLFKSAKGVYLIDRSLRVTYVGAGVEQYNSDTVTGAVVVPNRDVAHFYTAEGRCLVYDYYWKGQDGVGQWSVCSVPGSPNSVTVFNGAVHYSTYTGKIYQHTPDDARDYTDSTYTVPTTVIETAWIKTGLLQGFQRTRRAYLLGTYRAGATVAVDVASDYAETFVTGLALTPAGIAGGPVQVMHHVNKQKSEAIRFRVTTTPTTVAASTGIDWTGLTLEIGQKRGGAKLSAGERD